jgi:hypothetical protein
LSANQKGNGLISRAVREALGTLVAPPICEQLIERSLRSQGVQQIPEEGSQLARWLELGLKPVIEHAVGLDAAELVLAQLAPIAAHAAASSRTALKRSHTPTPSRGQVALTAMPDLELEDDLAARPTLPGFGSSGGFAEESWEPSATSTGVFQGAERLGLVSEPDNANELRSLSSAPAPKSRPRFDTLREITRPQQMDRMRSELDALPRVLAATSNPADIEALQIYLAGTAHVVPVRDLAGLLDALGEPSASQPLLLVDCQRPSVHVQSVAAIQEDLPAGSSLVVWGADDATWTALEQNKSQGCRWVRCSREATTDDVGSLCSMLLG